METGIEVYIAGVGGTSARFEIAHTLPDQLTQTEAEAVRDFLLDLCETKYSTTNYSADAALISRTAV